jgi:hypothetical protein
MVAVSGAVMYQGKPIPDGEIRFVPTGDTRGPTSAALVQQGRYEVTARGGVPAGTHRVEVRAFRAMSGSFQASPDLPGAASGQSPKEQYLPKQYNDQSGMTVTIESGQRRLTKDFALGDH